ncbi:MAG: methyltransferase family protein [Candidatus Thorarchaeota archaeon]
MSQIAVSFGIGIQYIILLSFVYRLIFGFEEHNLFFILDLPIEVYWIGIIGMWLLGFWVSITFIYNVNYTACFKQMKEEEYALATGGTYKYVRHPAYIAGVFEIIFIFLGTGIWFMFFGLIGFLALPYQAKGEEKMLEEMFGEFYEEYASKTGRFFPKIKRINKK